MYTGCGSDWQAGSYSSLSLYPYLSRLPPPVQSAVEAFGGHTVD